MNPRFSKSLKSKYKMRASNLLTTAGVFLIFSLIFFSSCKNGKHKKSSTFELKGDLAQAGEGIMVYLDRLAPNDSIEHLDSTAIDKSGNFVFNTEGIYKGFYTIRITKGDFAALILDSNEKATLTGNAQNLGYTYDISGSPDSKLFWKYNIISKTHRMQIDSMQRVFESIVNGQRNNKKRMDSLNDAFEKPFDSINKLYDKALKNLIRSNSSSFACLAAIQELAPDEDKDYYYSLDSGLMAKYGSSSYIKLFHSTIEAMKKVDIGAQAPDFSAPDTTGTEVSLASLHGKYVLIDFWASWCEPCKESLPDLIKIYDEYKDKNFTILGVSLDNQKGAWKAAIKHFNLQWTQISELKKWNSKVVKLYNFDGIPFTVLISPEGKIIAKKLSDSQLEDKLQAVLQ